MNTDHYQRRIQELTDDLSNMRKEMRRIEEHSLQPSPEFLELEKEMLQVKVNKTDGVKVDMTDGVKVDMTDGVK